MPVITIVGTKKDVHLVADIDLLELALMNLIENAAKYSNPPAQIQVTDR